MIESSLRLTEFILMLLAVGGACLFLAALVSRRRQYLWLGAALTAIAFLAPEVIRHPYFNVVVVREAHGTVAILHREKFYDGSYETVARHQIPLAWSSSAGGPDANLIVNDSSRLVRVEDRPSSGAQIVLAVVLPGEQAFVAAPIHNAGRAGDAARQTIVPTISTEARGLLTYTGDVYNAASDGAPGLLGVRPRVMPESGV
jgi:hypothetical protein